MSHQQRQQFTTTLHSIADIPPTVAVDDAAHVADNTAAVARNLAHQIFARGCRRFDVFTFVYWNFPAHAVEMFKEPSLHRVLELSRRR